ncbi:hypothetical protein RRF57_002775 [Xylaria bambusicola]|uniref:Uncharacterized protein n=1 Tax=Xylaria bambusicola TaxID=326684 RepID=A0AAN7U6U0_9PEZI
MTILQSHPQDAIPRNRSTKAQKGPTVVKYVGEHLALEFSAKLQHAGVLNGSRGFLVTENGRDISDEYREVIFLEWPSPQHLRDFVASPELLEHRVKMKPYVDGPTDVKLFNIDSDDISSFFAVDALVEYLVVKPRDTSEAGVQSVSQYLQSELGSAKAMVGSSSNLETREIAVVSIFASDSDLNTARASAARQQLLTELAKTASTTSLVAHVKKVIPPAEK